MSEAPQVDLTVRATQAGRAAHQRGAPRTPHHDPEVAALMAERGRLLTRIGVHGPDRARAIAAVLGFWLAGWDASSKVAGEAAP